LKDEDIGETMKSAERRHLDNLEKQKGEKENEAKDFLEQIKHNALFDDHTK
jgi:hypothetical protein